MRCGALWARKRSHDGCGTPLITTVAPCWRRSLDGERMQFFSNSRVYWSRLVSRGFTRMDGAPTSVISTQSSMSLANSTRRQLKANISIYGLGSNGSYVAPSVFPKRQPCMILWSASLSTATSLGSPSDKESTALKHLPLVFARVCYARCRRGDLNPHGKMTPPDICVTPAAHNPYKI